MKIFIGVLFGHFKYSDGSFIRQNIVYICFVEMFGLLSDNGFNKKSADKYMLCVFLIMTEEIISEVKILDSENLLLVLKRGGDISYQHGNKVTAVSVATQVLINVTIPNQPIRRRVRNDVT